MKHINILQTVWGGSECVVYPCWNIVLLIWDPFIKVESVISHYRWIHLWLICVWYSLTSLVSPDICMKSHASTILQLNLLNNIMSSIIDLHFRPYSFQPTSPASHYCKSFSSNGFLFSANIIELPIINHPQLDAVVHWRLSVLSIEECVHSRLWFVPPWDSAIKGCLESAVLTLVSLVNRCFTLRQSETSDLKFGKW